MEIFIKKSLERRAAWNKEMNQQLYQVLESLTYRALAKERDSWFGSLIGLLNHILVTDVHWLDRFRALASKAPVLCDGRLACFSLEWKPLSDDFAVLKEWRAVVDGLICEWFAFYPGSSYDSEFSYEDSGGSIHKTTDFHAFDFLMMHQNYHRGQISQILDEIGLPHSFADNGGFEELGK